MAEKKMKTADELIAETKASPAGTSAQPAVQPARTTTRTNPNTVPLVAVTDEATANQNKQNATEAYNRVNASKPGEYQRGFTSQLDDLYDRVLNGGDFKFNMDTDELYNQYKEMYMKQGKQAAEDTMGQAAALSGGYGNSYAVTAANQSYQGYMNQLNDRALDIYDRRYNEWQNKRNDLYNQIGLLENRDNIDYSRYRDTVSDWETDRGHKYQAMIDAYEQGDNERAFAYAKYIEEQDRIYQAQRDAVADQQWQQTFDFNKAESDRNYELSRRQLDQNDQINALNNQVNSLNSQLKNYEQFDNVNFQNITDFITEAMNINYFPEAIDNQRGDYKKAIRNALFTYYQDGYLNEDEVAYLKSYYGLD